MATPYFSVVIPTFNRSELFPLAVRSILDQTFEDHEIIVSDNFSADSTPEVAKQFTDPRVSYVRTPRHYAIADSWEFARTHAKGKLIIMLSDDDALVGSALEQFHEQAVRHGADFIFSRVAVYQDQSYPGTDRNSVACPDFSGVSRRVAVEEFVGSLFAFRSMVNLHPSAFAFSKSVADMVAERTGRYFWTNGVEYSAWLTMAVFAKAIVQVDLPLIINGRTSKSWSSNIAFTNPGKEKIQELVKDIDQQRIPLPLNNFTMCNLMAEGIVLAKSQFPEEFAPYEFNETNYLRSSMKELKSRRAMGVDVSAEIEDALRYSRKYPLLIDEFRKDETSANQDQKKSVFLRLRSIVADLGGRTLRRRMNAFLLKQQIKSGSMRSSFVAFGEDFGFNNSLECAKFLERFLQSRLAKRDTIREMRAEDVIERSIVRS